MGNMMYIPNWFSEISWEGKEEFRVGRMVESCHLETYLEDFKIRATHCDAIRWLCSGLELTTSIIVIPCCLFNARPEVRLSKLGKAPVIRPSRKPAEASYPCIDYRSTSVPLKPK